MRKAWAGRVDRSSERLHHCWRLFVGRSFSADAVEQAGVHVGAEAVDLPLGNCAVAFVGAALHRVDKPLTK